MPTKIDQEFKPLSPAAAKLAGRSSSVFDKFAKLVPRSGGDDTVQASLQSPNGDQMSFALPDGSLALIAALLREASRGHTVRIVSSEAELTTQAAADILGVSRPYIVKLLENGQIAFRTVGSRRRIRVDDLLDYQAKASARQLAGVDELVAESQRLGLY